MLKKRVSSAMRGVWRVTGLLLSVCLACVVGHAQALVPRAYLITPVRSNAVTLGFSYYNGHLLFDGALPITDSTGRASIPTLSLYHSLSLFGRSANIAVVAPYTVAHFQGTVMGAERKAYRSGLLDTNFRFSVNLKGGPAMSPQEYLSWRQKTIIGASLTVVAPTGQYDPALLLNLGANRWAFKPEVGLSQRWGPWVLDAYGAVWLFTTNKDFLSHSELFPDRSNTQAQSPMGAFESHLSYDVKNNPRLWFSLDGNYWYGGRTSLNGKENLKTLQANSRIGVTASVPLNKHQSLKFSFSDGTIIRYGGNFQTVSAAWQYSWVGTRAGNILP